MAKITQTAEQGDCIAKMKLLPRDKHHLIIADPPYNRNMAYEAYADNKKYEEYVEWTKSWMRLAYRTLHEHGSMWIFAPDEWASEVDMFGRHGLKMTKRRHVVWAFTFGQCAQKNFTQSHCHILYFTKKKTRFTWNSKPLAVPSARQLMYADKRANPKGKMPDATWMLLQHQLEPFMTPDRDTWLVSRICGTFKERGDFSPNQIPVPIMERIVLATSNRGDYVLDPFAGTCSSGIACAMHGRNWLGLDLSKKCIVEGSRRLRAAKPV